MATDLSFSHRKKKEFSYRFQLPSVPFSIGYIDMKRLTPKKNGRKWENKNRLQNFTKSYKTFDFTSVVYACALLLLLFAFLFVFFFLHMADFQQTNKQS